MPPRAVRSAVGDCLQLLDTAADHQTRPGARSPYFYQLLRTAGVFGDNAPTVRALKTQGQLTCEQLIDRYNIGCQPIRDLLVDYLRERQPGVDYATLHKLSYTLGRLFWRDLEMHHPGIDSLRLPLTIATAWKQRIATKTTRSVDGAGRVSEVSVPRINALDHLITIRAFYLDITQWAAEEPARWGPWVAPCPIREPEASSQRKRRSYRKSQMDQRTRDRMPLLPVLTTTINTAHKAATDLLHAAAAATPGEVFVVGGQSLRRSRTTHASVGKTWAEDPTTGKRCDLTLREHQMFWTWAAVEVLRHTGPHRGTRRTVPPQPHPIQAARHRRTRPAAADRAVQDRHRTTPGHQPQTGRRAVHDHLPDPRRARRRPAGRGL